MEQSYAPPSLHLIFGGAEGCLIDLLSLLPHSPSCINSFGMVSSLKNELYSDDTMPKIIDIRRLCRVGVKVCNDLPKTPKRAAGREIFLRTLTPIYPSCINVFWHCVIPIYILLMMFSTVLLIFPSH